MKIEGPIRNILYITQILKGPFPGFAPFQDRWEGSPLTESIKFETALPLVFSEALFGAALIFTVLILVGGIQYMAAAGDEQGTTKAKKLLTAALVGFALIMSTWAIMLFVFNLTNYKF